MSGELANPVCKVAIVGAGLMARDHARAFAALDGVSLEGIYSRTRSKADVLAAEVGIANVCDSVDELYAETRADLVVVTVPELSARAVATECCNYPWTILLEKPAGYDLADALAIQETARRTSSRVYVALNRRFHSSSSAVLDDLQSRDEPRFVVIQDQEDLIAARKSGQPELVVKNWMFANSIHLIDYFRLFCRGPVTRIDKPFPFDHETPTATVCTISFASGDRGLYHGLWNAPGPWSVGVSTRSRRWELRPLETASYQDFGSRAVTSIPTASADRDFRPGLLVQAKEAVKAVAGLESRAVSLDDATETMHLIHRLFIAKA